MPPKKKAPQSQQKDSTVSQTKQIKYFFNEGKTCFEKAKTTADFVQAIQYLNTSLEKSSKFPNINPNNIYHLRGQCFYKLKEYEKAEKDLAQAIMLSDEKSKISYYHSLIKCKLEASKGQKTSAIEDIYHQFERAVEFSNNKSDGLSYFIIGNTNKMMGKMPDAIKNYGNSMKNLKNNDLFEAYFNRGLCYRKIQQIENSIDDFLKASDLRKDEPYVQYQLGLNYLDIENYEQAKGRFNKAIELEPSEPLFRNAKGLALYNKGQHQKALSQTVKALELYQLQGKVLQPLQQQSLAQCYYNQANILLPLGKFDQAHISLSNALIHVEKVCQAKFIDTSSILIKIFYTKGLVDQLTGSKEALKNFSDCLQLITQSTHKLYLPTLYHLALNQHRNHFLRQSIDSFTRILSHDCYDKCVYENRGKVYLQLQMYSESLKDFEKVSEIQSNYPDIYFYKGIALNNLGRLDQAIKDFQYSLELLGGITSPNQPIVCKIFNGIAESYLKLKRYQKSLFYSNIALKNAPNNEQFLVQRSKSYLQMNLYEKAIQDLTQAIASKPSDASIYYQRGFAYYKSKNFELAIKDLYDANSFGPSSIIQPDIQYLLGICYANLQEFSKAIDPLTSAIQLNQKAKYYHQRAKCYLLIDKNKQALSDLNKVIQKQPNNAYAYFRRAFAYKGMKNYQQTAEDFQKARSLKPNDPKLIINKKQIYEIKNKKLCDPGQEQD